MILERIGNAVVSYEGRMTAAIVVLASSLIYIWALFHYRNPIFLLFFVPIIFGVWGIRDAVKRKRAGEFDNDDQNT